MNKSDLQIEQAALVNYNPDQVWARKLVRELANKQYRSAFIEQLPDETTAEIAVGFSYDTTLVRVNNLFATVPLAKNNEECNPEVYISKKKF